MPYNAPSALKIVPGTDEVTEVGSFGLGGWKWHGGLRSGRYIIAIPSHADFVLRIETETDGVTLLPTGLIGGCYKWAGGVADGDGNVWTVPGDSAYTLKVVPTTGEVVVIGGLPHMRNKWQNGVCGRDGNVVSREERRRTEFLQHPSLPAAVPQPSPVTPPSWPARAHLARSPDVRACQYCIPCDSPQVLCIHTRTGEFTLHGDLGPRKHKFQGACESPPRTEQVGSAKASSAQHLGLRNVCPYRWARPHCSQTTPPTEPYGRCRRTATTSCASFRRRPTILRRLASP
eukprot:2000414-Prymnesium_polylepis.1